VSKIRVLIVDDSVLFRSQIQLALTDCPEIEVVGASSNGKLALERLKTTPADLMILDLEMPVMDGMTTLMTMKEQGIKTRVILFSSQSRSGAEKTLEALHLLGATDFVAKPSAEGPQHSPSEKIRQALYPKILSLFHRPSPESKTAASPPPAKASYPSVLWETFRPEVLVIASSTGGPNALLEFFENFKGEVPYPILVAQHMPPLFTTSLAERLGVTGQRRSKEAENGELLQANTIYVAPGDYHLKLSGSKEKVYAHIDQGPQRNFVRPCADHLFETAAAIYGRNTLGVVLTGMGRDGAQGAKVIKDAGGAVLIQNKASCVVYGMPGATFDLGAFDREGAPSELARIVQGLVRGGGQRVA